MFFFQADYEKLKHRSEAELSAKLESKTKGLERIVVENERLRREIKRVTFYLCSISFPSTSFSSMVLSECPCCTWAGSGGGGEAESEQDESGGIQ